MDLFDIGAAPRHQREVSGTHIRHGPASVRIILLMSNALDCDALSKLFEYHQSIQVVEASPKADVALELCRRCCHDVTVICTAGECDALYLAAELLQRNYTKHVVLLGDRVRDGLVNRLIEHEKMSYLVRRSGFQSLSDAVLKISANGERVFDTSITERIVRTPRGIRLKRRDGEPSVASLTKRERDIMRLLASGRSVRDCAEELLLAESTIDNHKSRLMKKLGIHKTAELTQLAIRDGLIWV